MNILIVGAGSVGKIYGHYLFKAGAKISFLLKEKHVAEAERGFTIYPLNQKGSFVFWNEFKVLTTFEQVKNESWDFVILAFASTSLKEDWLKEFIPAIRATPLLSLQPGLNDQDHLLNFIPKEQLLNGTIPIISYEAPMAGETFSQPGTAFWIPPGAKGSFSAVNPKLDLLLETFQKSNFPVKRVEDSKKQNVFAAPVLMLLIGALMRTHWSFQELKKSSHLKTMCDAISETVEIHAARVGEKAPGIRNLIGPTFFKTFMSVAPHFAPFNLETYLKVHFSKVGDQMKQGLIDYIEYGKKIGLPTSKLEALNNIPIEANEE